MTFRFLENAFTNFFGEFLLENNPSLDDETLIKKYSLLMLECLTNAIKLLPEQILQIFKKIKNNHWNGSTFANLILVNFIFPAAEKWLFNYFANPLFNRLLNLILRKIGDQKNELRNFYHELFYAYSYSNVPSLFQEIRSTSYLYYISVNEVLLIAKALNNQNILLENFEINSFLKFDSEDKNIWFWCYVYPTVTQETLQLNDRLIYTSCQKPNLNLQNTISENELKKYEELRKSADSFEELIELMLIKKEMITWKNVVQSNSDKILISNMKKLNHNQINFIKHLSPRTQFTYFLKISNDAFKRDDIFSKIDKYGNEWNKMYEYEKYVIIKDKYLHKVSQLLKSFENTELPGKFLLIIRAMSIIDLLFPNFQDEGDPIWLKQIDGKELLRTYIHIQVLIFSDPYLSKNFKKEFNQKWLRFERIVLKCLQTDISFLEKFVLEQNEILEKCSQSKSQRATS